MDATKNVKFETIKSYWVDGVVLESLQGFTPYLDTREDVEVVKVAIGYDEIEDETYFLVYYREES